MGKRGEEGRSGVVVGGGERWLEARRKFLYYIGNAGLWQKCSGTGFVKQ